MQLPSIYWILAFVAAAYVWLDGRQRRISRSGVSSRNTALLVGWSIATFLVPIVFLPLWLWRRDRVGGQASGDPAA